jgi:hypothetical protein
METAVDVPECVTSRPNGRSKYVYVNTVKKLQAQAEQQAQLHQELSQQIGLQLLGQSVLADGICQQKVVYDVIIPLHQQWLQDPDQDLAGCQHQQHSRWQLPHPELATLVGLMENCNPIVSSLLKVSVSHTFDLAKGLSMPPCLLPSRSSTCFALPISAAPVLGCILITLLLQLGCSWWCSLK